MKGILLPSLLCFAVFTLYGQKVKFRNVDVPVSYVELPTHPILDSERRTYSVHSESVSRIERNVVLPGFKRIDAEGTIDIHIKVDPTTIDGHTIENTEQFKKDKEGNRVSQGFLSKILVIYSTSGGYSINDHTEKDVKHVNFGQKGEAYSKGLLPTFYHRDKAAAYFKENRSSLLKKIHKDFTESIASSINFDIIRRYGYQIPKINYVTSFLVLKAETHNEYTNHKNAVNSIKKVFLKMKYSLPIDGLKEEIQPVIEYYKSVIDKYPGSKKAEKKMRLASYYNIGNIYYYLDMPDESIKYGQKIIENGMSKGKGKFMITLANRLKKSLSVNEMSSRHMQVISGK